MTAADNKPLAIDLFTGIHGWAEGLVAEGWRVVGFDIVDMCRQIGLPRHEGVDIVLQDVLTIHGRQFKDADLIVASPPCQFFSYVAMPWSRGKALAEAVRNDPVRLEKELALFKACFRIQREACEAAGRHIPMVVENVRGAEAWVGRAAAKYGSFYLWGDVPALMPITRTRKLGGGASWYPPTDPRHHPGLDFTRLAGMKTPGFRFDGSGRSSQNEAVVQTGIKCGGTWFDKDGVNPMREGGVDGVKQGGDWFATEGSISRATGSKSNARKAASAMIAKIPLPLARWIGHAWYPVGNEARR